MDSSLFGDDEPTGDPAPPSAQPAAEDRVADWQVTQLRKALDATGLTSMEERQALIVELVGRPVASLRDLSSGEALRLADAFAARKTASGKRFESWDDREDNTWIDKL